MKPAIALAFAAAIILLLSRWHGIAPPPAPPVAHILPPTVAPPDHADALARLDRQRAVDRDQERLHPDQWIMQEKLAATLIARARLSGDYADYRDAGAALDRGFTNATADDGPHLAAAAFELLVHRFADAEGKLAAIDRYAIPASVEIRADVAAMRGDIAFYRGRYALAARRYEEARALAPSAGLFARRALLESRTGRIEAALATLDLARRTGSFTTPQAASGLLLQRGAALLQAGRWDEAEAAFTAADRRFPGSWLIAQHRAQMIAVRGDLPKAVELYTAIVARTGNPEAMDALAALYRADGDYARSHAWAARAARLWEARLRLFPEAAAAHALDHYLAFGPAPCALDLARRNFAARPYGAAGVALGWALMANARPADALRIADAVTATGWISAEQHVLAAEANAMLGRGQAAEAERKAALALNPRIYDRRQALIWFGH